MKALALALLLAALAACAHPQPSALPRSPDERAYPTQLVEPSSIAGDFLRRQRLSVTAHGQGGGFDAVLQKKGDSLVLVGLTPFGTAAFSLEQRGQTVRFTPHMALPLAFSPRFMLNDIDRTYFKGLGPGPFPDGLQVGARDGEQVEELWRAGRLWERHYRREGFPGEIAIVYKGGMSGVTSPVQIDFDNGWLGYHLSIATLSEQAL